MEKKYTDLKLANNLLAVFLFLVAAEQAGNAQAKSLDYGSFESLFGEPVTTSVTGTPQRASDVAANMTIINADQIRQSGTRSIAKILGLYVPGIDVLQESSADMEVGMRGYQQPMQPRLQVLLDGRQVFSDDYSRTMWNNLPVDIDDIRQIEVVKGASSALFGSNAAGGVVNIVTYSALYDKSRSAYASYGTQNTTTLDSTYTQHLGEWGGTKISAGGMAGQDFATHKEPGTEDNVGNNPQHQYVRENTVFKLSPDAQATFDATYSNAKYDGTSFSLFQEDYVFTTYSVGGNLSWDTPYGVLSDNTYFNHTKGNVQNFLTPNINAVNELFVNTLADEFRAGDANSFRVALEYRRKVQDLNISDDLYAPQHGKLDGNVYTASGTWLWQISDKLSWTNAVRADHEALYEGGSLEPNDINTNLDSSINAYSANSGLVYHATSVDTFRATYGRGIQLPSMIQSSIDSAILAIPGSPGLVVNAEGNPNLKPTVVENYELDYDRSIPSIYSTAKIAVYYENNKDLISPIEAVNTPPRLINGNNWVLQQCQNVGSSHGAGGEVELSGKSPGGFRWDGSYSLSTVADAATVASTLGYDKSAPESHFRLLLGYTTGPWELDANGQLVTSTDMLRSVTGLSATSVYTPGYASVGGRIGYNITQDFTIALSGTNLTRADTQENPYPAVERQVFLGLSGKF